MSLQRASVRSASACSAASGSLPDRRAPAASRSTAPGCATSDHGGEGEERLGERAQRRTVRGVVERHGLEFGAGRSRLHQRVARPDPGGEGRGGGVAHDPLRHTASAPAGGRAGGPAAEAAPGRRRRGRAAGPVQAPWSTSARRTASRSMRSAAGMAGSPGPESRSAPPLPSRPRPATGGAAARPGPGNIAQGDVDGDCGEGAAREQDLGGPQAGQHRAAAARAGSGRTMSRRASSTPAHAPPEGRARHVRRRRRPARLPPGPPAAPKAPRRSCRSPGLLAARRWTRAGTRRREQRLHLGAPAGEHALAPGRAPLHAADLATEFLEDFLLLGGGAHGSRPERYCSFVSGSKPV